MVWKIVLKYSMDDQNIPTAPVEKTEASEPALAPVEPDSGQTTGSNTTNMPPEAPESPINDDGSAPVEDQNPSINQPESNAPEEPIYAPNEPEVPVDGQLIPANDNLPESE